MNEFSTHTTLLEEEKVKLEGELASVGRKNPVNSEEWEALPNETGKEADSNDQAVVLDEYQENRSILGTLELRYKDVTDALKRIEDGTYGICEVSGEKIEAERLAADPAARTSIANIEK